MELQTLYLGSTGPLVGFLQFVLKRLGFYSGEVNYVFDETTERAVAALQSALGLSDDEYEAIFHENAERVYKIGKDALSV